MLPAWRVNIDMQYSVMAKGVRDTSMKDEPKYVVGLHGGRTSLQPPGSQSQQSLV